MEQEAFQLILLNKVRQQRQQVQEQAPIVAWAKRYIPKLSFEEVDGKDALVIGNQLGSSPSSRERGRQAPSFAGEIWGTIAKDTYWDKGTDHWVDTRELVLVVSEISLCVSIAQSLYSLCSSSKERGQARLWVFATGEKYYPPEHKTHVDAMLFQAAKRFGWEVLLPEKEG